MAHKALNIFHKVNSHAKKSYKTHAKKDYTTHAKKDYTTHAKKTGEAITPVVEEGTIPSDMTTGRSGHMEEVVVTARPKKTRAEHRLDKTQVKGEAAADAGNYEKANRLQARKQRLLDKIDRQKDKDKKKYARKKKKKFWQDN
jgi:hypothetical protein|tara:strand:+ start:3692 stop:4120 length:429 start_codon:yes stop_codon:yes gene_type:complete